MLLDIHTHLDMYRGTYLETALEEIRELKILTIANSLDYMSYKQNCEIASRAPMVVPVFGVHPANALHYSDKLEEIEEYIDSSLLLGEIGLDSSLARDYSQYEAQKKVFEYFLHQAKEKDKVVIIHCKDSEEDVLNLLKHYNIQRAVIHRYTGPIDTYLKLVRREFKFSIGFMVKHSDFIRVIARKIPPEQLLIETDNPSGYEEKQGVPGMPLIIRDILLEIARLRNQSQLEIGQIVWENFMNMLNSDERREIMKIVSIVQSKEINIK